MEKPTFISQFMFLLIQNCFKQRAVDFTKLFSFLETKIFLKGITLGFGKKIFSL